MQLSIIYSFVVIHLKSTQQYYLQSPIHHKIYKLTFPRQEFFPALKYEPNAIELDNVIGQELMKQKLRDLVVGMHLAKYQQEVKSKVGPMTRDHVMFIGRPGTGKTTIARLFASCCHKLKKPDAQEELKYIETSRSGLVGSVMGETEEKVKALIMQALDGYMNNKGECKRV